MSAFTAEEKIDHIRDHQGDGRLFEDIITALYTDWLSPGDRVIDAGANRGHHTFQLARLVGSEGQVLAIEPVPALADRLDAQIRQQGLSQVRLLTSALGASPGVGEFFYRRDMDGWSSLFEQHKPPNTDPANITRFLAPILPLNALRDEIADVRFIKLDLELNEFSAIRGAKRLLERDRPLLAFENARQRAANLAGYKPEAFFSVFRQLEYALFDIFGDPFTPDRWQGDETMPVYNIAVPKAQVQRFQALPFKDYFQRAARR